MKKGGVIEKVCHPGQSDNLGKHYRNIASTGSSDAAKDMDVREWSVSCLQTAIVDAQPESFERIKVMGFLHAQESHYPQN